MCGGVYGVRAIYAGHMLPWPSPICAGVRGESGEMSHYTHCNGGACATKL